MKRLLAIVLLGSCAAAFGLRGAVAAAQDPQPAPAQPAPAQPAPAQPAPAQPAPAQPDPTAPEREAVTQLVQKYTAAVTAGDGKLLWTMISQKSHEALEKALLELRQILARVPADRLDVKIESLKRTPRELQTMDAAAFLGWAVGALTPEDRADLAKTKLAKVTVAGTTATLTWTGPLKDDAPARAVKESAPAVGDAPAGPLQWKLVLEVD